MLSGRLLALCSHGVATCTGFQHWCTVPTREKFPACRRIGPAESTAMKASLAVMALCWFAVANAQQPVYLCNGTYTDQPCRGGKEVEIVPSRGAHSMSGTRRESREAVMEDIHRRSQAAQAKGLKQANDNLRCQDLRRRRMGIDKSGRSESLDGERLHIREEQFALRCRQN